jgi:hypothetical protein
MDPHRLAVALALALATSACSSASPGTSAQHAVDLPGTADSAARLAFGVQGYQSSDGTVGVSVCLNADGVCVPSELLTTVDCHSYREATVDIDGVPIPQVAPGGVTPDGQGCTFPMFKTDGVAGLVTSGGAQQVTVHVAGASTSVSIVDLFVQRQMALTSSLLITGTQATATVTPRPGVIADQGLYFVYDDPALDDQWTFAKDGYHGSDVSLADAPELAWDAAGFSFLVPTTMPAGTGTFGLTDDLEGSPASCPFAACVVHVFRDVEIAGVPVATH